MRFSLASLLLLVAIAAVYLATATAFWEPAGTNYSLLLGFFLLAICLAGVSAFFGGAKYRPAFAGASVFGVAYLAFVLKGGFGLKFIQDAQALARNSMIGFPLLVIAFLATHWIVMITTPLADKERNNSEPPGVL